MPNNKKIVHVVPAYPPSLGGMEQRVFELVNKLYAQGVPVEVFTSNLNTTLGDTIEDGVVVHRLRKLSFLQTPISFSLFFKLLFAKADVFHIHLAQPFFPVVASLVAVLRRKPYIIHIRAIIDSSNVFGKFFVYLYTTFVLGFVLRFASKIIVLTDSYTALLVDSYQIDRNRIIVIPNATDFVVVSEPKTTLTNPIKLIAVGRVDHQKNYFFMFRCLSALKKQGVQFVISIVGVGRQQAELQRYAKELGIEDEILWRGRLEGDDLEKAYAEADLFVHTALFEGFATVLIEAMSKGLPICAGAVLGVQDVVKHEYNGLLSPLDETTFVQNLQRLITDRDFYASISRNNLKTVPAYKWSNIMAATFGVYESIIKEKYDS